MHGIQYKAGLKLPRPGRLDMSQRLREHFSKRAEVSEEAGLRNVSICNKSREETHGNSSVASLLATALPERTSIPGLNKRQVEALLPTGWSPKGYQFPQSSEFQRKTGEPSQSQAS